MAIIMIIAIVGLSIIYYYCINLGGFSINLIWKVTPVKIYNAAD